VPTPTKNQNPSYTFSSTEAGAITYGGSCSSATTAAVAGNNTITLRPAAGPGLLPAGTYSNCTVTVTDAAGNASTLLTINTFTVDITPPSLAQVTAVPTPTKNQNPSYTFSATEAGAITYGGSCSSATTAAVAGNNTITLRASAGGGPLPAGTYSTCTVTVTDAAGNASTLLTINTFTVDITPSTLAQITAVPTPTTNHNPSYTFSSTEAGAITYGGSCSSATAAAVAGNNTITLRASAGGGALPEGTYSNCTVAVTDAAGNASILLSINTFTINNYTISFSLTGSGTILCPGSVPLGGSFECTVTPGSGYSLESLLDNSVNVTGQVSGTSYSVANVTSDHTLNATFKLNATVLRLWGESVPYSSEGYSSITEAYADALNNDDILIQALQFNGNLDFNKDIFIMITGGYDTNFVSPTGFTTILGIVTISSGTVDIEKVIIR
jgi:hypothetical protein